jgi:lysophospholipase L1-like esterase
MNRFAAYGATAFFAPLLWAQGRYVRATVPELPEAAGPREGILGQGPDLSVLIVGDSAGAGVGAKTQDEALLGHLTRNLAQHHRVTFALRARTGMTTHDALEELFIDVPTDEKWDLVVMSLGVNDATHLRTTRRFFNDQKSLHQKLQAYGPQLLVLTGLPPVHRFPALPQPLRRLIGERANRLDAVLRDMGRAPGKSWVSIRQAMHLGEGDMASDGFHPGPAIYAEWARAVADEARKLGVAR